MQKGIAKICAAIVGLSLCMGLADYPVVASGMELITEPVESVGTEVAAASEGTENMGTFTYSGENWYEEAYEVLELVNQERVDAGLNELTMDQELLDAAMLRAAELSVLFSHTRPNGESCFGACIKMSGENIAAGYQTAKAVMYGTNGSGGWMNSEGHQANILTSDYNSIGIGCFYHNGVGYWVQCFSRTEADAAECPENQTITVDVEVASDYLGAEQFYYYGSSTFTTGASTQLQLRYINSGWDYARCVLEPSCFEWTSDNEKILVDESGKVTCNGAGTFTITATLKTAPGTQITYSGEAISKATAITLDTESAILELGGIESLRLNPTLEPEDVTDASVAWTSSNKKVATVDETGTVTAVAPGNAVITVRTQDGSNLSATCEIEVRARVTDITLSAASHTMAVGDTYSLQTDIQPSTAYNQAVVWYSENDAVATVDANGTVTAISSGTTTIICMSEADNDIYTKCEVTVSEPEEPGTEVPGTTEPEEPSTEAPGTTEPEAPSTEAPGTTEPEAPGTEAPGTTEPEEPGTEAPGTTEPEAPGTEAPGTTEPEAPGTEAPDTTEPEEPSTEAPDTDRKVTAITLSRDSITTTVGKAFTLRASVTPEDATNTAVIWTSSDNTVATVSSTGRVRAVGTGTVTITCIAADGSGAEAQCDVTIRQPIIRVQKIKLSRTNVAMTMGTSLNLKWSISPGNASNQSVCWTTSNSGVATVNANGRILANAPGRATITCTATDGSGKKASCTVWVYTNTEAYVARIYTKALGREAEEGGLNYWTSEINNGYRKPVAVAEEFFFSEEFMNKNLDNTEYVKVLYRTFMGREYDQAGLNYWVDRLNAGESRQSVLKCFAGCPEFQNIVAGFGL